jgi:CO/xanthine dehydrogenase Mo-binding subunit
VRAKSSRPPLAAIANALSNAAAVRMTHIPMSPPRVLKAIDGAATKRRG